MDAVITFVDGSDPLWQQDYERFAGEPAMAKRFRDWGTLRYLLRGIETHLPFIRNVYLLVARESQVPDWVNREHIRVVLHRDVIPEEYLPTFNSCMIEMFLHRIPGLDEEYLYFNDDMFPVMDCDPSDFFVGGKAAIKFSRSIFAGSKYKSRTRNSDHLARQALGLRPGWRYIRPQHLCSPMLRSECEALFTRMEPEILRSLSRTRNTKIYNQYAFLDYCYYHRTAISRRISGKYFSLAVIPIDRICAFVRKPSAKIVCINDTHMGNKKYLQYRSLLTAAFESHFPEKSRFEC